MGEAIFAKWVLGAAFVFGGQVQDSPPLEPVAKAAGVRQVLEVYETRENPPCQPGADSCPGPIFTARARPLFCAVPGVYTVTLRLGLLAPWGLAGGKVWLEGAGEEQLVAAFTASPGTPAYVAGSLQVAPLGETCYRFRVETSAPVEAIGDPRVSFVSFGR